ncbi:MAG: hypothetical protein GY750_09760 [Lentisphaerae bacterium]|nr:hypothetical protein [Lentisphaerota bacterium]MCP4101696.1 hypothetical protein [Lentisphaerota bacterium]
MQTISSDMLDDQKRIVIRATSKIAPGYLRGQAYDKYQLGTWMVDKNSKTRSMRPKVHTGMLAFTTFSFPKANNKASFKNPVEIMISSNLRTKVIFTPGNIQSIDIIAEELKYNTDGVFTPKEWIDEGGYTVYRSNTNSESAWQEPTDR